MEALARAGFDIVHPFDARAVGIDLDGPPRGLLVGNTRALWPHFVDRSGEHPLERYIEQTIDAAFPGAPIYYAHRRYGGAFLPMQRIAVLSGLGALAPTQLVIHPIYGPWFALRAIVLVPGEPPAMRPIAKPCRCDGTCEAAFARGDFLAARDACTLRTWRYSQEQIDYHYAQLARFGKLV